MAKDIIYTDDIEFLGGDLKVDTSDLQHVEHILIAFPGNYKASPWMGIGIEDYKNASMSPKTVQTLEREIKLHLESDGAKNTFIQIDSRTLDIDITANYD
jgi:7,8-dihydro-6-hydroxymethylpterin-pyrophosphokinase